MHFANDTGEMMLGKRQREKGLHIVLGEKYSPISPVKEAKWVMAYAKKICKKLERGEMVMVPFFLFNFLF